MVAALKKHDVYVKDYWKSKRLKKWIYVVQGGPFIFERQRAGYDGLWAMEREAAEENG